MQAGGSDGEPWPIRSRGCTPGGMAVDFFLSPLVLRYHFTCPDLATPSANVVAHMPPSSIPFAGLRPAATRVTPARPGAASLSGRPSPRAPSTNTLRARPLPPSPLTHTPHPLDSQPCLVFSPPSLLPQPHASPSLVFLRASCLPPRSICRTSAILSRLRSTTPHRPSSLSPRPSRRRLVAQSLRGGSTMRRRRCLSLRNDSFGTSSPLRAVMLARPTPPPASSPRQSPTPSSSSFQPASLLHLLPLTTRPHSHPLNAQPPRLAHLPNLDRPAPDGPCRVGRSESSEQLDHVEFACGKV